MQHCFSALRRSNVVVGKNYRLQNIQLSKISLGGNAPESVNVGCGSDSPKLVRATTIDDLSRRRRALENLSPPKLPGLVRVSTNPAPAEAGLIRSPKLLSNNSADVLRRFQSAVGRFSANTKLFAAHADPPSPI
jgi:hypothetical protein